ncbi:hypothetical protein FKP32DRAFT_1663116 [Trametes sanguinea]|nr:hypothetical protein FKP32DRAFT_1663116 [Trametes sanguinea]
MGSNASRDATAPQEPAEGPQAPNDAPDPPAPPVEPGGRRNRRSRPMQRAPARELHFSVAHPLTRADLRAVRALLARLGLPAEIVLQIIDEAAYYPSLRASLEGTRSLGAMEGCARSGGGSCAARLCLIAPPLPGPAEGETWRVRRVVWDLDGRDQGWGGEAPGTFRGAYSWYEACIIRPLVAEDNDHTSTTPEGNESADIAEDSSARLARWMNANRKYCAPKDALPDLEAAGHTLVPVPVPVPTANARDGSSYVWLVQRNRVAVKDFAHYRIEWAPGPRLVDPEEAAEDGHGTGEGFVEALRPGDRVALWMRAQYPGWANTVSTPAVEVLYDVY